MRLLKNIVSILILLHAVVFSGIGQSYYTLKKHPVSTREYDEIAPVMLGNKMVFCSNRPVSGPKLSSDMENRPFFKIVESEKTEDGKWKSQQNFDQSVSTNFHDGPVCFNEKGDFMAYSRCFDDKPTNRDTSKFGLFFAELQNGSWANIQEFEHNDRQSNTMYPTFNKDATEMYFSSNRKGFGGYDLYVSRLQNGRWTVPENLGPRVNTADDERYPILHPTGRLYFSSDGHDNRVGGYDLFYTESYDGKWISPIKLPATFNTGVNEYTFYIDEKFESGFYTNNRGGSRDIWTFTSTIPNFEVCQQQRVNNFCFVFFEENTLELDTTLYLYEWDLGDKTKIRSIEAQHCYAVPGDYVISLNVIDKLTKEVLFNQAEYQHNVERIIQSFITCPDRIKINEDTQFSGLESFFKDVKAGEYYWDFGDGIKGIGASTRHTYLVPGSYTIKLGVIEDNPDVEVPKKFCSYKTIVVTEN